MTADAIPNKNVLALVGQILEQAGFVLTAKSDIKGLEASNHFSGDYGIGGISHDSLGASPR